MFPAHAAEVRDVEWVDYDQDWQQYAGTGRRGIASTKSPRSRARFRVEVPTAGEWQLAMLYGTDGVPGVTSIRVDEGDEHVLALPATLVRGFLGRAELRISLSAGAHVIDVAPPERDGEGGRVSDIALDRLELTPVPTAWTFEAGTAMRAAGTGSSLHFFVGVTERAVYRLNIDADGPVESRLEGLSWADELVIALPAGVSEVVVTPGHEGVTIQRLRLALESAASPFDPVSSVSWSCHGSARLVIDGGTEWLDDMGDSKDGQGSAYVNAPVHGRYLATIRYSNADRQSGHEYNADVIDRRLSIRADDSVLEEVFFPFTHHMANWRELSRVIEVPEGARRLWLAASVGPGPRIAALALDPLPRTQGA
jgi:hypothetical protein